MNCQERSFPIYVLSIWIMKCRNHNRFILFEYLNPMSSTGTLPHKSSSKYCTLVTFIRKRSIIPRKKKRMFTILSNSYIEPILINNLQNWLIQRPSNLTSWLKFTLVLQNHQVDVWCHYLEDEWCELREIFDKCCYSFRDVLNLN